VRVVIYRMGKIGPRRVVGLASWKKRLSSDVKILEPVMPFGPRRVVVIPESEVNGKSARHFPVVLAIEIPVRIPDADKPWECLFIGEDRK